MIASDLEQVVEMVKNSFDQKLQPFMTFGQHGIVKFLELTVRYPSSFPTRRAFVVVNDENVVEAFADFRISEDIAFLSYICVRKEARGRGLATEILRDFFESHEFVGELQLDVFSDNRAALGLYTKLGFEELRTSLWVTRPMPTGAGGIRVADLPSAMAAHDAYGFCEMDVVNGPKTSRLGLLGNHIVNCMSVPTFEDDETLAGLRATFPSFERAFAIVSEVEAATITTEYESINSSRRMRLRREKHTGTHTL
jgi:ribosomal protein S18 acetylase RimI-like enzyme